MACMFPGIFMFRSPSSSALGARQRRVAKLVLDLLAPRTVPALDRALGLGVACARVLQVKSCRRRRIWSRSIPRREAASAGNRTRPPRSECERSLFRRTCRILLCRPAEQIRAARRLLPLPRRPLPIWCVSSNPWSKVSLVIVIASAGFRADRSALIQPCATRP